MDDRDVDGSGRRRIHDGGSDSLAAEVWASALLIALAVLATVGVALLANVFLRSGS